MDIHARYLLSNGMCNNLSSSITKTKTRAVIKIRDDEVIAMVAIYRLRWYGTPCNISSDEGP